MPYNLQKENDTKENNTWMEKCVGSVSGENKRTGKPYTKGEKVAICKVQLNKKGTSEAANEVGLREIENILYNAIDDETTAPAYPSGAYLVDTFDTYVIISKSGDYFKVPYLINLDDKEASFEWDKAKKVLRKETWEEASETSGKIPNITSTETRKIITHGSHTI